MNTIYQQSAGSLSQLQQKLQQEEREDQAARGQYAAYYNLPQSQQVNQPYMQHTKLYQDNLQMKQNVDKVIVDRYNQSKQTIDLLQRPQADLNSMIPKSSAGPDLSKNECVMTIKQCMQTINDCDAKVDDLMKKSQGLHKDAGNFEELLLKVHKNLVDKKTVRDQFEAMYEKHFEAYVQMNQMKEQAVNTIHQ